MTDSRDPLPDPPVPRSTGWSPDRRTPTDTQETRKIPGGRTPRVIGREWYQTREERVFIVTSPPDDKFEDNGCETPEVPSESPGI